MKDPYEVIKRQHVTEKSTVLGNLHEAKSNRSVARCDCAKYVFVVAMHANKCDIARAVEEIYKDLKIKVAKVNTLILKSKPKRRGRGRPGRTAAFKKAVVTLQPGDKIEVQ